MKKKISVTVDMGERYEGLMKQSKGGKRGAKARKKKCKHV